MFFKDVISIAETLEEGNIIEFDKKTLILASNSKSRLKIMQKADLDFVVVPSFIDEEGLKKSFGKVETQDKAIEYVKMLALAKARWVKDHTKNTVVLAADTIAFYDGEILEKPKNEEDARRIFTALSDSIHVAITGVCIIDDKLEDNFVKVSPVKMLEIPIGLQDILVKDKLTYTYAGGYCVDGNLGDKVIVDAKEFNNVLGLPIEDIMIKLKEAGYDFSK